jgi:Rad3-related DNA helicase
LELITYGNGVPAKDAFARFREGEGTTLAGCTVHYTAGIDLPAGAAPFIFFLRPGYPNPGSPEQQFWIRRFGNVRTRKLKTYEVMLQVVQTAGRNIRSDSDRGLIILVDSRFRKFAFAALPQWLQPAYRGDLDWDECVQAGRQLLAP